MISRYSRTSEVTDSKTQYGLIPMDHWVQPDWINEEKATKAREQMMKDQVIYGGEFPIFMSISETEKYGIGSVPCVSSTS